MGRNTKAIIIEIVVVVVVIAFVAYSLLVGLPDLLENRSGGI